MEPSNFSSEFARYWQLDPEILFLNHGSFGACPTPVLDRQQELRARMEREPLVFLDREFEGRLYEAKGALARFVGADSKDLAFVPNATSGVNAVLRSLRFSKGDRLLVTDHEYNACRNALDFVAKREGAEVNIVHLPFPLEDPAQAVELILEAAAPGTRLALIDHITSPTALVLPIEQIVSELNLRGIDTLVDGAHGPGMVPLDVAGIGAAYYTGNCHKWLCAPKGAAFLHVRPDRQRETHPVTISHGYNMPEENRTRFLMEFDWTGTADPTAYLCVPEAIRFMGSLVSGGWPELMARNRSLVREGIEILREALDVEPACPDSMIGSMASLPLPDQAVPMVPMAGRVDPLQEELFSRYRIEVPVIVWPRPPKRLIRITAQIYNTAKQYEVLAGALRELRR